MSEILTIDTSVEMRRDEKIEPLPLYTDDLPMLHKKIPEYIEALPNTQMTKLIKRLKMTMKLHGGIGLSANQCGVFERVFIIGHEDFFITCINPEVIENSIEMKKEPEGCLSFPGMSLKVERPSSVLVKFLDENGTEQKMWLDGITARCYLHELDHMNGITFIEKVGPVSLKLAKQKQNKFIKQTQRKLKRKDALFV
jgi:peptide deformylase